MIALYLLAAHMFGDFVLQTRWQATAKLTDVYARERHVFVYCLPFVPIVIVYGHPAWRAAAFMGALAFLHTLTDTRRFRSTLGDVLAWQPQRRRDPAGTTRAWIDHLYGPKAIGDLAELNRRVEQARNITGKTLRFPPPNPWASTPILVDQTLHICQLAILGGLLLR